MLNFVFTNSDIKIFLIKKLVKKIDNLDIRNEIIQSNHNTLIAGHSGIARTLNRIKAHYTWPTIKKDVTNFIKNCHKCQVNKYRRKTKIPMKITSTSVRAFQRLALDIVGPLVSTSNENIYILTMIDDLTKYLIAVPLPNAEAKTVADAFVKNFLLIYGQPESILTDQGSNFMSDVFKNVCKLFKIKIKIVLIAPVTMHSRMVGLSESIVV
jgi:hypothetical protein